MSEANTINDFYRGYLQGFKDSYHWVGLMDEEIMEIGRELGLKCRLGGNQNIDFDYARAIEAKLKAKNERLEKNT